MNDPTFLGASATAWTAIASVVMAVAAVVSVVVSVLLMRAQAELREMQSQLTELQRRANWLNGALESHSSVMLRLRAEELGRKVIWWDPTHDGPVKKPPPLNPVHGQSAARDEVYVYVPPENRRFPDIT